VDFTVSVGKPSALMSNFWTVRIWFGYFISESKPNFGYPHTFIHHGTCSLQDIEQKSEKISEMTAVMCQAANMEDRADSAEDVIVRLQRENHVMRELLQLELLHSSDELTGAEIQKPLSSDVAIQTHASPDDDPFCTGDFDTIRPRLLSSRTPTETKTCSADENTQRSTYQQDPDSEHPFPKFPLSLENSADTSSNIPESSNNDCSSPVVSDVDTDDIGSVNSSKSVETLVNPSELSSDNE